MPVRHRFLHNPDAHVISRRQKCKVLSSSVVQQAPLHLTAVARVVVAELCDSALIIPPTYRSHCRCTASLCPFHSQWHFCIQQAEISYLKSHFKRSMGVQHLVVRPSILLLAPQQHTGRPQLPSVLICFDCSLLIIENNKVRSFLSCLVCCLSLATAVRCSSAPGSTGFKWVLLSCQGHDRQEMVVSVSCRE